MTVIDDNPKGTPIMSRNASDIRIESAGDTSIFSFKVSVFGVPDAEVGQFVPLNGEVAFRMKEILSARKIRLGVFRPWHRAVVRRALFDSPSGSFPVTLIQNHPDSLIYVNDVAAGIAF